MHVLLKELNKYNGNLCFVGVTDSNTILFECNQYTNELLYAYSTKAISGISLYNYDSYLVTFADDWLGLFSNGVLTEAYMGSRTDQIIGNNNGYYVLDRAANQLSKVLKWTLDLPDYSLRYSGNIMFRGDDIIYYNSNNTHLIRDDAVIINSLDIDDGYGRLRVVVSDNPEYVYVRSRTVNGSDFDYSSSSFSSSSNSSSSSS